MLKTAIDYINNSLSIIPIEKNSKKSVVRWESYQNNIANKNLVLEWFKNENNSLAIICGNVSGNLEAIDIDAHHYLNGNLYQLFIVILLSTFSIQCSINLHSHMYL